jgi:co-chaperonin GroES (HSP10)
VKNESGIHPCGDRVLILPDDIEKVTEGGIIIPGTVGELHQMAQSIGTFIEAGPDAYSHWTQTVYDAKGNVVSVTKRGYSQPFAKPGDRVAFAKYGGLQVTGSDGKVYRLMNDEDVTAEAEEGVSFTDLKSRQAFHGNRK